MPIVDQLKEILWMFGLAFALAGVQFCYSIQFSIGTPLFTDALKMPASVSSVILATAGPVSGFFVQPIVGAWSDKSTYKYGRRRPFIFVGVFACALGMALIGFSTALGELFGDIKDGPSTSDHTWGCILAIIGLFTMNIFVNVIQGPARAVVADILPDNKQQQGNAIVSGVMGMSAIIANIVGAQFFLLPEPYRNLFIIGLSFVLVSSIPTLILAKEKQHVLEEGEKPVSFVGVFKNIYKGFRYMPKAMYMIVAVLFLSWCGYSPYMIYATQFFGNNIYHGDSRVEAYKNRYYEGVMAGMYALAIFSAGQWIYAFILPVAIKSTSVGISYGISQLIATGCYFAFNFFPNVYFTTVLMVLISINFTTMNSVPFALIKGVTSGSDAGLYMGVLNAASVIAQTVSEVLAGQMLNVFPKLTIEFDPNYATVTNEPLPATADIDNVGWGIFVGGMFSTIATVVAFFLKTPQTTEDAKGEYAHLLSESEEEKSGDEMAKKGSLNESY